MPFLPPRRQSNNASQHWLRQGAGLALLHELQHLAIPELTRVFGHSGLYLRPFVEMSAELSGNMLAQVLCLHRVDVEFSGQLRCEDARLPIASDSLSLAYAFLVLETSPEPEALLAEIARTLKPEGIALIISHNPWSLSRLSRSFRGTFPRHWSDLRQVANSAGLELVRHRYIGPHLGNRVDNGALLSDKKWFDGFRALNLTVLRRRDSGLTPLRKTPSSVKSFQPGVSAG